MIVTPTPDVVLDVLEAADPATQRAATAKLDALKSSDAGFDATMEASKAAATARTAAADPSTAKAVPSEPGSASTPAPVQVIKASSPTDVYRKFEAFVLQVFVETM